MRYVVSGAGLSAALTIGEGAIPVDRLNTLSLNLRLRTPGAVSLVVSGGLSYLPRFTVAGSIPLQFEIVGSSISGTEIPLGLAVEPTDSQYRFGLNGGVGLRVEVARSVSLVGEIRGFFFREYELVLESEDPLLDNLLNSVDTWNRPVLPPSPTPPPIPKFCITWAKNTTAGSKAAGMCRKMSVRSDSGIIVIRFLDR